MALSGILGSQHKTRAGSATNAYRPSDDSLVTTKEPLMGKVYPISSIVNQFPPKSPLLMYRVTSEMEVRACHASA